MKKMINSNNIKALLRIVCTIMILIVITSIKVHAQPADPGGEVDAPIDGGLSLLIAGGVGYGVKKVKESRKSRVGRTESDRL